MEKISKRCGKGHSCEFYDPNNRVSGCKIFDDRKLCSKSMKQRRKAKMHSQKRGDTTNW